MTSDIQTKREIERLISRVVISLDEGRVQATHTRATAIFRQIYSDLSVGYADVSALRVFFEQKTDAFRAMRSAADLEDLISDGMRSRRHQILEACRVMRDVLSAKDSGEVEDVYVSRRKHVARGVIGRGIVSSVHVPMEYKVSFVSLCFDQGTEVDSDHVFLCGDKNDFSAWNNALPVSNRLFFLSTWDVGESICHHLVALKDDVAATYEGTWAFYRYSFEALALEDAKNEIALASVDEDKNIEISNGLSVARLCGMFLGNKRLRSLAPLIEEGLLTIEVEYSPKDSDPNDEGGVSTRRLSDLFFGRKNKRRIS